jgi:transposase InsO family protein
VQLAQDRRCPKWTAGRSSPGSDITYLRLKHGFAYLVAVMDWFSRYGLAWELSLSLESDFCVHAVQAALAIARPEIVNTDRAPVRTFIISGDNSPFPVEVGTAQHLTQQPKGQWGQSVM